MDKLKVLLVDDMATARHFIKYGLESNHSNLSITEASNGKEALVKLEAGHYDLVLCDWEMPQMTGEDLLRLLRGHDALKDTKFIMITAKSDRASVIQAMQMGVNGFLVKPFTIEGLLQKMADVDRRFDRRKDERYDLSGIVTLQFGAHTTRGELLDLSMGGLLAVFSREDVLPQIFEKTASEVGDAEDRRVAGIAGFVVRIQAADAFIDSANVKIAVKFIETDPRKLDDLKQFLNTYAKGGAGSPQTPSPRLSLAGA